MDVLQEEGTEALSVRRVASKAGVSMGTLRYYFESQDTLKEACLEEYHEMLLALEHEMAGEIRHAVSPRDAVSRAISAIFSILSRYPALHRLRVEKSVSCGELTSARRQFYREPFINTAAALIAPHLPSKNLAPHLVVDSIMRLVAWYAACSESELCSVARVQDAGEARQIVQTHCTNTALCLVFGPQ